MDMPQLLTQGEEVIGRNLSGRILQRFDKRKCGETRSFDICQIDGCGRSTEIGDADLNRLGQRPMPARFRCLLKFIKCHMNLLQPFVGLLHEELN